jgi:hypothetical protein
VAIAPTARVSAVFRFLQDKNGLPAQGVAAQLWRRLPGQPGGVLVEKGVSDAEGYVRIEVRLGRAPQTPEEYRLAAVKGDIQKSWALPEFPAKRIWELHLLDEPPLAEMLERQRRLAEEMTLSEMQTVIKEARRKMAADPDAAAADLKLALESVRRAPDLSPKTRAALVEDLQKALRGAGAEARRTNLDSKFAPAGKATEGWTTVAGSGGQEIERGDFTAVGDFALHFTVSASRGPHHRKYPRAAIVLVGADGGDDLKIEMAKLNSWSGVDTWEFQTPAGKSSKGLAPGSRTLTLRREGELFTFTADAVFNQNSQDRTIAKFPAGNCGRFAGMRLAVSGPDITPERLRIEPVLRVR